MSILKVNPESYSEVHSEDGIQNNWAAVYAKSEIDKHSEAAVLDHPDGSVTKAKLADDVKETISKAEKYSRDAKDISNTSAETANTARERAAAAEQRAISAEAKSDAAVSSASIAVQKTESVQSDFTKLASEFEGYKGSTPDSLRAEAIELGENITINAENTRLAIGSTVYQAMPHRIGVWTDGTPIWRVAFEKTIPTGTSENKSDVIVSILLCSTCKRTKLIDCDCFSTNDVGGFGATHHQKDNISFMNNGIMNISFQNGTDEDILYGWVEFVAPYESIYPNDCYMDYRQADGTYRLTGQQANEILVKIPEAFIGKDNICFSMSIKKTAYQQIDIAYGDGNDVLLNSFAVENSNVYEAVSLYNTGYPATANSWFKIRCHSGERNYLTIKDIVIGEV